MHKIRVAIVLLAAAVAVAAQQTSTITAAEAKDHVGERATVCGQVVGTHLAARSRGSPTFINLDRPYPNQIFTIVIWGSDRAKFGNPEQTYQGKQVQDAGGDGRAVAARTMDGDAAVAGDFGDALLQMVERQVHAAFYVLASPLAGGADKGRSAAP